MISPPFMRLYFCLEISQKGNKDIRQMKNGTLARVCGLLRNTALLKDVSHHRSNKNKSKNHHAGVTTWSPDYTHLTNPLN